MAKEQSAKSENHNDFSKPVIPAGYVKSGSNEIVGIWDPLHPGCSKGLHFIPMHRNVMDNVAEPSNVSTFIVGRVIGTHMVLSKPDPTKPDEEKYPIEVHEGDLVGLWFSSGMRGLEDKCGIRVYMFCSGEIPLKPLPNGTERNPMKKFEIHTAPGAKGKLIPVESDTRRTSKERTGTRRVSDDNIPF
jgi:hypothetical protein